MVDGGVLILSGKPKLNWEQKRRTFNAQIIKPLDTAHYTQSMQTQPINTDRGMPLTTEHLKHPFKYLPLYEINT